MAQNLHDVSLLILKHRVNPNPYITVPSGITALLGTMMIPSRMK